MVKILKYAEEQGKKKGKAEGKLEGKIEGKIEGKKEGKQEEAKLILLRQIKAKFGRVDNKIINLINKAELDKIEDLSEKVVTSKSEKEIIDFLEH